MLSTIIAIIVVLLDQISKHFVCTDLKSVGNVSIIEGILDFTYVENRGAAFGILSDNRAVFMVVSVIIDFIDFCAFDFWVWVFNIADCAVVVGCILAIIFVLFDKKASSMVDSKSERDTEKSDE